MSVRTREEVGNAGIAERKSSEAALKDVENYLKDVSVQGGFACHTTAALVQDKALLAELKLLTEFPRAGDLTNILTQWNTSFANYEKVQQALNTAYQEWETVVSGVQATQKQNLAAAKAAAKKVVVHLLQEANIPLAKTTGFAVGLVLTPLVQGVATVGGKVIDALDSLVQSAEDTVADGVADDILGPSDDQITREVGEYDEPKRRILSVKRNTRQKLYRYLIGCSVHTENVKGKASAANDQTDKNMTANDKLLFEVRMALKDLWTAELSEFRKLNKGTINDRFGVFVQQGVENSFYQEASKQLAVDTRIELTDEAHFLEYCLYKIFPAVQSKAASTQLFAGRKLIDKAALVFLKTIGDLVKVYATMLAGGFNATVTQVISLPSVQVEGIKDVLKVVLWMKCYDLTGADKPPPTVVDELVKLGVMERWNQGYGAMASNLFSRFTFQSSQSRMDSDGRMGIYEAGKLRYGSGTERELQELASFAGKVGVWWATNKGRLMNGEVTPNQAKSAFKGLAKESWILENKNIVLP